MSLINKILSAYVEKKLGADFEERAEEAMKSLGSQNYDRVKIVSEIIENYESILQLLCPNYQSVRLDKDDLLTIYIDDKEYDLDDKSSTKKRKAVEHRMAIECLLADVRDDESDVMIQVEKYLNCR